MVARWFVSVFLLVTLGVPRPSPLHAQASDPPLAGSTPPAETAASTTLEGADPELSTRLRAVRTTPSAQAHRAIADAYLKLGILDAAYQHYTDVIRYAPDDARAHEAVSQIWRGWGYAGLALVSAHRAVWLAPQSPSAHNTLGAALLAAGDVNNAKLRFARAAALAPAHAYPLVNLCLAELRLEHIAEASAQCDLALALDPSNHGALTLKGFILARAGAFPDAHRMFLLAGSTAEAAYRLGQAYAAAGRVDDAVRAFQAALLGDGSKSAARTYLRQLQTPRVKERP